jgi:hypothetical protein
MRSFNEAGLLAVVENGVAHPRKVAVVREFGQQVEVNSDVKRGDQALLIVRLIWSTAARVRTRLQPMQTSRPRAGCRRRRPRAARQF